MAIITRLGKGAPLTFTEMDNNLNSLSSSISTLTTSVNNQSISTGVVHTPTVTGVVTSGTVGSALDQLNSVVSSEPTFRNKIINGDIRIDQRNGGGAVTPTVTGYTVDRWNASITQASKLTFQQVNDAPTGFKFSEAITVASQYAPLSSDVFVFRQLIEGQNIIDLSFGTATPATLTCSLWVKGSVAGTYCISVSNGGLTRSYVGTITVTTSWAKQSLTLIADNTGTWATDNTAGLVFALDLGSGSSFAATAGSWQAGNFYHTAGALQFVNQVNGSSLKITGIQIEIGSASTSFEQRPVGYEFASCQRYYQTFNQGAGYSTAANTTTITLGMIYPVKMRTTPTPTASAALVINNVTNFTQSSASISVAAATDASALWSCANFTGLTAGSFYILTVGGVIQLSAEL